MKKVIIAAAVLAAGLSAQAADTLHYINADISTSTNLPALPADNFYSLTNVVYVMPGASLTLEEGVVFKNYADGSLGVTRGAQLFVEGTVDNPVIFTSTNDNFSSWIPQCNQWGSIAICGNGLISASHYGAGAEFKAITNSVGVPNSKQPDGRSDKVMEGLTAVGGDTRPYYGGNNDCDDSGSIKYISIRYGGQQSSEPNKELNGLSLGGVGQETDVEYVEIMNNVDDGIEIWGGKVHLKHVNIWNIGDDSFDIDQGWRGRAQFGLIVQGHSGVNSQGGGIGDNMFEHDGAEDSDAQPVTTGAIWNFTAIGNPDDGDGATVWRDGARIQYRNCIFMDCGEKVIRPDGDDGDGAHGYGYNGTLTLADVFATDSSVLPTNSVGVAPQSLYTAQTEGTLAGFENCIFYGNSDYTEFDSYGQNNSALNNIIESGNQPIVLIERDTYADISTDYYAPLTKDVRIVTNLNPCAAAEAAVAANAQATPDNGFYDNAPFIGGFSANNNWLLGWTAADQFGFVDGSGHVAPGASIVLGGVTVSFQSQDGVIYEVESSADAGFTSPVVVAEIVGDGSVMGYTDASLSTEEFYRVVYK